MSIGQQTATAVALILLLLPNGATTVDGDDVVSTSAAPLPPDVAAASMQVPPGFEVSLFAGEPDVMQPIGFCLDDRGRLWVAEAYNYPEHGVIPGDRIVILEDTDGDGRMDERKVFFDGLNYVTGIEVGFGGAWVMSPPSMFFIPDADGDDVPDSEPSVVLDGFGNHANAHNLANGFAWGPDGWLYGTHGRTNWSMIGKPGTPEQQRVRFDGGVYRYHPVRDVWEPYADGTTNPWGIDWNDFGDAFICNCVNPHLFQVIQGAHYEPWRGRQSSQYAYQRIDTIADHLHFTGLGSIRNGIGSELEDQAGGGHAHCGTMIYLGDQFPDSYRNQLFTNNIHGRRINNDLLRRSGSGYVASHGPDLMRSHDPWYMGVTITYGPGGEVYASDWSDTGECHSTRNTRKSTGRIYRITYKKQQLEPVDLGRSRLEELVAYQTHDNDWYVRHARRLLQERAAAGESMDNVHRELKALMKRAETVPKQLRAMWALWVTGGWSEQELVGLLDSPHEAIRSWAVTLLCEDGKPDRIALTRFVGLATAGDSARVRLSLASGLQRLAPRDRWPLAEALSKRAEDSRDQNLPLMAWYGIEPLVHDDRQRLARLATQAAMPRLRINAARRLVDAGGADGGVAELMSVLKHVDDPHVADDVVAGILAGFEGRRQVAMPASWPAVHRRLRQFADAELSERSIQLALIFNDSWAIAMLRSAATDVSLDRDHRWRAIEGLVASGQPDFAPTLLELLHDSAVCELAISSLAQYREPSTAEAILGVYPSLPAAERRAAIATLCAREVWAFALLDAAEKGLIDDSEITAFNVRQLTSLGNRELNDRLRRFWGELQPTEAAQREQIDATRRWLTPDVLTSADRAQGKRLFGQHCGTCHTLFGEGRAVGPDITGAQRSNLDYMLENIIAPNASVSKDYQMRVITTVDGRVVTGLVESESTELIIVLTATERVVIPRDEIEQQQTSVVSMMPTGMLESMTEHDIRDLIGFLQRPSDDQPAQ